MINSLKENILSSVHEIGFKERPSMIQTQEEWEI